MRIKKVTCVIMVIAMVFIMAPLPVYAADSFSFQIMASSYENKTTSSTPFKLVVWPSAGTNTSTSIKTDYKFESLDMDVATCTSDGTVTIKKAGTVYIGITGTQTNTTNSTITATGTQLLTFKAGGSGSSSTDKKLTITSNTSLDKKLGDPAFTFSVSFNIPKKEVEYSFGIDHEDIATIDEDSGLVRIRKVGSTVITVSASAPGYTDSSGNTYADATKEFTLYVDSASGTGGTGTGSSGEITLSGGGITPAPATTPATTPAELIAGDSRYSNFELKGNFTLDGMLFRVSRNFSTGNAFAIVPEKPDGDWWKTPNSFTGSRGIYAATSAGVAPLIYADTTGKQYIINVNSYKLKEALSFKIPERIPVGALFGITPPVSTTGRWFKDPEFLSGNSGTYIPLKTGATRVTFESEGQRYHIILDIVGDSDAVVVADSDSGAAVSGSASAAEPIILG